MRMCAVLRQKAPVNPAVFCSPTRVAIFPVDEFCCWPTAHLPIVSTASLVKYKANPFPKAFSITLSIASV
ncbi:hypothetical protein D3C81_1838160 [compost metagenome]